MTFTADLGFLGGGQLARMSIQAAQRMGLSCISLDPGEVTPASSLAPSIRGRLDDPEAIADVAARCGRLTLENEFIPADALRAGLRRAGFAETRLTPGVDTLAAIQDKLLQREAYRLADVPSPKALPIDDNLDEIETEIGFPMVLKARFGGYDGKGTRYARTRDEFESHRSLWESGGWMAEQFVDFTRELAVMAYLSPFGDGVFPTMETVQTNHVCDLVFPAGIDAGEVALAAARAMGGFGLFGVELFEARSGEILVNEIAPRPHNTGHYTLDWGGVSQFEQHVRISLGLPPAEPRGQHVCMANLLGQEDGGDFRRGIEAALEDPDVHVHWYGKAESRPGRKMGHLNVLGHDLVARAKAARARFYRAWTDTP